MHASRPRGAAGRRPRPWRTALIALLVACALVPAGAQAAGEPPGLLAGYVELDAPTGPLWYRGWSESRAAWAAGHLARSRGRIEERLERRLNGEFTAVLVPDLPELRRIAGRLGAREPPDGTRGIALPGRRTIIVRGDLLPVAGPGNPLAVTLSHEVAHLVIRRRPRTRIPRWLDEGLAVRLSQGFVPSRGEAHLAWLARTRSLYRLDTLEDAFPGGHVATTVAYRQSCLVVEYLAERHGEAVLPELLDRLEAGATADEALTAATGSSPEGFEEGFREWLAARRSLAAILLAVLANPWSLMGLLALVAIVRFAVRRRRGLRRLELEDPDDGEEDDGAWEGLETGPDTGPHRGVDAGHTGPKPAAPEGPPPGRHGRAGRPGARRS